MKIGTIPIKFTRPFWGGLLIGVSFGLILGPALVEHVALDGKMLIVLPSIVLVVAGVILAKKAPDGT